MARGREGILKRERERRRQQRQEEKRSKRQGNTSETEGLDDAEEARLLDSFRVLSEQHAAGHVSESNYLTERHRIFVELGIEQPDG